MNTRKFEGLGIKKNEIKAPMKRIISIWEIVHEALKDKKERSEE